MSLVYNPPGPVAAAFLQDRSLVSAIMGPMGSGKTSAVIMKTINRAKEMKRSKLTGVRLYKCGVVRDTFTDLKRTTMKSIENWFGSNGKWGGGGSSTEPPYFKVDMRCEDGTVANLWYEFVGLDTHNIEQLAKGWEITDYWRNEADLQSKDVHDFVDGRAGRYPSEIHGKPDYYCGILDYNAPDTEHYLYDMFEVNVPDGYRLFKQPGGRSAGAENLQNLPDGYYDRMALGKEDWWIRRNIDSQYGYSRDGKPVYGEYRDDFHCAPSELVPVKGLVVRCDFDQGLHPACILRQTMPNGQVRVLDELYTDRGAKGLCEDLRRLKGGEKYAGLRLIGGLVDPAAAARDGTEAESWVDAVNRFMGWTGSEMLRLAETNQPDRCISAVRYRLKTNVDDGRPGLLISPSCKQLRKGFNSGYKYKRMRIPGGSEYDDKPQKTFPIADLHNALQYGALADGGYEEVVGKEQRAARGSSSNRQRTAKVEVRI